MWVVLLFPFSSFFITEPHAHPLSLACGRFKLAGATGSTLLLRHWARPKQLMGWSILLLIKHSTSKVVQSCKDIMLWAHFFNPFQQPAQGAEARRGPTWSYKFRPIFLHRGCNQDSSSAKLRSCPRIPCPCVNSNINMHY